MGEVITVGLDIAKHVFQVNGVDANGAATVRRKLRRADVLSFFEQLPPCLVGIEACATGHHWTRELIALGHDVRLMPASYVKPYVKRQKNDAADAEVICEAVTRPTKRFVPIKTVEQQSVLMVHRSRELLIRQRTMTTNARLRTASTNSAAKSRHDPRPRSSVCSGDWVFSSSRTS